MRAWVLASFARQAMMATLGTEMMSVTPGRVELALSHDERFTQQHGFLHTSIGGRGAGQRLPAGRTLTVCRGDAFANGASTPFAIMQATMTAVYGRPGIQH